MLDETPFIGGKHIYKLPESCPFTIDEYHFPGGGSANPRHSTFLIREHDSYGEFPHIYAKICRTTTALPYEAERRYGNVAVAGPDENDDDDEGGEDDSSSSNESSRMRNRRTQKHIIHEVIVLSDTGCGTEVPFFSELGSTMPPRHRGLHSGEQELGKEDDPEVWNLRTFLEYTINPGGRIPYLVMTTHCHYDHILGISKLSSTDVGKRVANGRGDEDQVEFTRLPTTVLSSSHDKCFITPYANLQKHSLSGTLGLKAPKYDVGIWADDLSQVIYAYPTPTKAAPVAGSSIRSGIKIPTPYTILHTPGHTPDSLSWYDSDNRVICVGDSFYLKDTDHSSRFEDEPPMPTMFDLESDVSDWWRSLHKVLDFVTQKNGELELQLAGILCDEEKRAWTSGRKREETLGVWQRVRAAMKLPLVAQHKPERDAQEGFLAVGDEDSILTADEQLVENHMVHSACRQSNFSNPLRQPQSGFDHPCPDKDGILPTPVVHEARDRSELHDPWFFVDLDVSPSEPNTLNPCNLQLSSLHRVHLAAAHTTCRADAVDSILEIKAFMARVLRDEVPKKRVADGAHGEEKWLWDDALDERQSDCSPGMGKRGIFSVLAPLVVVEEGRKKIPRKEWKRDHEIEMGEYERLCCRNV